MEESNKINVFVLGCEEVGKTSLIQLWSTGVVSQDKPESTMLHRLYEFPSYNVTDTRGNHFVSQWLAKTAEQADMFVLVWHPENSFTFEVLEEYAALAKKQHKDLPIIFVRTKSDLLVGHDWEFRHWEEQKAAIEGWAKKYAINKYAIVETSATDYKTLQKFQEKFEEFLKIPFETEEEAKIKQANIEKMLASKESQAARAPEKDNALGAQVQEAPVQEAPVLVLQMTVDVNDATPLLSQFFQYTYAPALKHSRQLRATEINASLAPDDNGQYEPKQLMMLFAHYMSIRHVNSTLSRELEDKLVKVLMSGDEYQTYKNTCNDDRAGIFRGKKRDRVANALRAKIVSPEKTDLLIQLLDCVDDLETGFFSYKSDTGKAQIKGTMELADRVYEFLLRNKYIVTADVNELIHGLTLPSDAVKIMRAQALENKPNPLL